jgi:hypothetical protein
MPGAWIGVDSPANAHEMTEICGRCRFRRRLFVESNEGFGMEPDRLERSP